MRSGLMTTSSHDPARGPYASAPAPPDARLAPVAAALARRLRAACPDWDAAEFAALVEQMARTKLRWLDQGYGE